MFNKIGGCSVEDGHKICEVDIWVQSISSCPCLWSNRKSHTSPSSYGLLKVVFICLCTLCLFLTRTRSVVTIFRHVRGVGARIAGFGHGECGRDGREGSETGLESGRRCSFSVVSWGAWSGRRVNAGSVGVDWREVSSRGGEPRQLRNPSRRHAPRTKERPNIITNPP